MGFAHPNDELRRPDRDTECNRNAVAEPERITKPVTLTEPNGLTEPDGLTEPKPDIDADRMQHGHRQREF